jgi:hypothetical protein
MSMNLQSFMQAPSKHSNSYKGPKGMRVFFIARRGRADKQVGGWTDRKADRPTSWAFEKITFKWSFIFSFNFDLLVVL